MAYIQDWKESQRLQKFVGESPALLAAIKRIPAIRLRKNMPGKCPTTGSHEYVETDGDHSWPVWRRYLTEFAPKLFR